MLPTDRLITILTHQRFDGNIVNGKQSDAKHHKLGGCSYYSNYTLVRVHGQGFASDSLKYRYCARALQPIST